MAPIVMHSVIGERVYAQIEPLAQTRALGAFLLGCMLVDVNAFSDLDRRQTHFAGRPNEDGEDAFSKGSSAFLSQLDGLLQRPWPCLASNERAFVAGYLCHLAADEAWKAVAWRALWAMGITSGDQLPVPGGVVLTAYSFLGAESYLDAGAVADALRQAAIPDVLNHVSHAALARMWRVIQPGILNEFTLDSYLAMLEARGRTAAELDEERAVHERYLADAKTFIQGSLDVETMIRATVDRSLEIVPRLWS
jgi:hypothetical protein